MSGLRPQHLKDALLPKACNTNGLFLASLTGLVNCILSGNVPPAIQPVLFGAAVTAFNKKGGGVRPIAVGETFRRLCAKCGTRAVKERFSDAFSPTQIGFCVPGGAEAAAHASRSFVEKASPGDVMLKLDFSNAFNTMRRDHVAYCISEEAPELLPFFTLSYENDSILTFGSDTLSSSEGFQQGDPLAVFGFCLGLHKALCNLKSRFCIGYIDDVTIGDHWSTVLSDFATFKAASEKLGLFLTHQSVNCRFLTVVAFATRLLFPSVNSALTFLRLRERALFFLAARSASKLSVTLFLPSLKCFVFSGGV